MLTPKQKSFKAGSCTQMVVIPEEGDYKGKIVYNQNYGNDHVQFRMADGHYSLQGRDTIVTPVFNIKDVDPKPLLQIVQNHIPARGMQIAADPEMFVFDENREVIPAWKFLPKKSGAYEFPYWDGFQAEWTTSINTCLAYHTDSMQRGMAALLKAAKVYNNKAQLLPIDVIEVSPDILRETDPEYIALGCAPSRNIYAKQSIENIDATITYIRSAGCHLHMDAHFPRGIKLKLGLLNDVIYTLDVMVGILSVALLRGIEDKRRRMFYGRAGEFRVPKYGIEYRVLSSAVLVHPMLYHLIFDIARLAVNIGLAGIGQKIFNIPPHEVANIIDTYDYDKACDIVARNMHIYDNLWRRIYTADIDKLHKLHKLCIEGFLQCVEAQPNIHTNWLLEQKWMTHSDSKGCCVHRWL